MADPFIFKLLASITLAFSSVFIVLFAPERWRHHPYGVSVMVMAVGIWLFSLAAVLRQFLGLEYHLRQEMRILAQGFLALAMAERTVELAVTKWRRRGQADRTDTPEEPTDV